MESEAFLSELRGPTRTAASQRLRCPLCRTEIQMVLRLFSLTDFRYAVELLKRFSVLDMADI